MNRQQGASVDQILSAIADDGLRRLYLYWDEKRAGRHFPARRDIDPLDIAFIPSGWVLLIDVTYNPLRFRFRAARRSEMGARLGRDLTGVYVDEHPRPELGRHMIKAWRARWSARANPRMGFMTSPSISALCALSRCGCPCPPTARPSICCWCPNPGTALKYREIFNVFSKTPCPKMR